MKMYKMIFLSLGLFSFVMLGAQGKGGRILYEVTVNIHRNLPPERAEEMKICAGIPGVKFRITF